MKRFLVSLLTVATLLAPLPADAGRWVQKEIFWAKGGATQWGTVSVHDTTYAPNPFKTSLVPDTTGKFTLKHADVWRDGHAGPATSVDTVIVAYLLVQRDSTQSVSGPPTTVSSVTYEIDGRAGGYKFAPTDTLPTMWTQVDSTVATFVAGPGTGLHNNVLSMPIRAINGAGSTVGQAAADLYNFVNTGYRLMAFEDLRVRFTAVTGIMSGSLRAFVRYWDSDPDEGN